MMPRGLKKNEEWLGVAIDKELRRRLEEYCKAHGLKIKFVVARAIQEYLEKYGG